MTAAQAISPIEEAFRRARDMDASMNERLGAFAEAVRELNPAFALAVDRLIRRLHETGAGDAAPMPGDVMPPFVLPDDAGRIVSLEELTAKGPVAVTFHRGHWCPYCRISINTLARATERIEALGASIVAIVPEREEFTAELKFEASVPFPVLTDLDNGYALSLNLAVWVGADLQKHMEGRGRTLPDFMGNDSWVLPIPATFVVGRDGRVKARFVDPDYRRRMAVEDLLEALKKAG
jgi:peroxiredoxin